MLFTETSQTRELIECSVANEKKIDYEKNETRVSESKNPIEPLIVRRSYLPPNVNDNISTRNESCTKVFKIIINNIIAF